MRIVRLVMAATALAASVAVATPAQAATPFPATGIYHGTPVVAVEVTNVTVEGQPGATYAGQLTLFVPTDPAYSCLIGANMNVFSWNGELYIHNGLQGPQCTYGTWLILVP